MVDLEIDGRPISVEQGTTIIEAADQLGIYIPRFCYHKKLSIAANCRMCLVEVEKVGKPLPACATPVTQGMKVYTISKKAMEAQKIVMEFLLINHPLDCPICDQGGECELQDLAMGYGDSHSHYDQPKRAVFNDDLGPLIATEMTRCIQCTRCVRFGEEIAGMRELGVTFRGEHEQIGTYVKHMMKSEVSGNVIDLCPVGALLSKPALYSLRGWEVKEHPGVSSHDCLGSNIFIHSRGFEYSSQREVMRIVPRENNAINETWISDRDRYSYLGLKHPDRILKPRMKRNGQWQEVDWHRVLLEIADRTLAIIEQHGADQVAALASPNSTLEEFYLLQKWMRAFGSNHIDHRLRQQDFSDQDNAPEFPHLSIPIAEIEKCEVILLVGSHLRYEQPLLGLRVFKAVQDGAQVMVINPMDYNFNFTVKEKLISADMLGCLADVAEALNPKNHQSKPRREALAIAQALQKSGNKAVILMGEYAQCHPQAGFARALVRNICEQTQAAHGVLTEGANSAGAWLAGALPHRGPNGVKINTPGDHAFSLLSDSVKRAYFLLGLEPELDCIAPAKALKSLKQAGLVVCLTPFVTPTMEEYADFILPIVPVTENTGTFVNVNGLFQSFSAVSVPSADAKPAWKIIRVLANFMELPGFEYEDIHQLQTELNQFISSEPRLENIPQSHMPTVPVWENGCLTRLAPWPLYRSDPLVRRSLPLQETMRESHLSCIAINSTSAVKYNLKPGQRVTARQGDSQITLPLIIDERLASDIVFIPSALPETAGFGQASAEISLQGEVE